jgi:hypothetical protein
MRSSCLRRGNARQAFSPAGNVVSIRAGRVVHSKHQAQTQYPGCGRGSTAQVRATDESTSGMAATADNKRGAGRMTYKPLSYGEMVDHAVDAVSNAINDGLKLLEVEFPALPTGIDGA